MPTIPLFPRSWSVLTPFQLEQWGRRRVITFCRLNRITAPSVNVIPKTDWVVSACGYYRPDTEAVRKWLSTPGINICLEKCARLVSDEGDPRNWNWPCSTTDREPFGVIAHELGHHCDWISGEKKGTYFSEHSTEMMEASGEGSITSYAPDPAEWFAEMFRLFVTNAPLLSLIRPRTYALFRERWEELPGGDWRENLGEDVPEKIVHTLTNKIKKEGKRR